MGEQTLYRAAPGWVESAVDTLRAAGVEVLAPTETEPGVVNLAAVDSAEAVVFDYVNAEFPLKRLFLPITEVLLEFEKKGDGDVDVRTAPRAPENEVVVLGCRPCDTAALETLDRVFQWDYDDVRYCARRERTTLVSFACTAPGPRCFCSSVGGSPHGHEQADVLVFLGEGGEALMQVHTAKGTTFVERLGKVVTPAGDDVAPPDPPALEPRFDPGELKGWLDENFESEFWPRQALRCLGCGACTYLCPTCHCFDIVDEGIWNRGQRRRNWDCCSYAQFTVHASGHNPRPEQSNRFRQRLMHKFKYFPERFDRVACVGCGRCVRVCGVGQNLTATLADIESR